MNYAGYENLTKLDILSQTEGYFFCPRIDMDLLSKFNEGIIALTGSLDGIIPQLLSDGRLTEAENESSALKEIFGDRLYIELQKHGLSMEEDVCGHLTHLSRKLMIPVVATNNVHYLAKSDAEIYQNLSKITKIPPLYEYPFGELYLKSSDEMKSLFANLPEAIERTVDISDRCEDYFASAMDLYITKEEDGIKQLDDNTVMELNEIFKKELEDACENSHQNAINHRIAFTPWQAIFVNFLSKIENIVNVISEYYPFKTKQIRRFCPMLNWQLLSRNERVDWNIPFIKEFSPNFFWEDLSNNKALPWSQLFLEEFEDSFDWSALSSNEKLPWSVNLLQRFQKRWDWVKLSGNDSLPWEENLLDKYADRWRWGQLSRLSFRLSKSTLKKYAGKWHWEILVRFNRLLSWEHFLITKEYQEVAKYGVCEKDIEPWVGIHDRSFLIRNLPFSCRKVPHLRQRKMIGELAVFISESDMEKEQDLLDWDLCSANTGLPWSEYLIRKWQDKWNWGILSSNEAIPFDKVLLEEFATRWDWSILSGKPGVFAHKNIFEKFIDKWDWESLSCNNSLPWTEELLARYADKWDWPVLSFCIKKIPWTEQLLETYRDRLDWQLLSANESVPLTETMLMRFADLWYWDGLVKMDHFQENIFSCITDEMMETILELRSKIAF